jgi:hypothetical protein
MLRKLAFWPAACAGAAILLGAAMVASADTPGRHPRYLHARSDLRAVQWLLRVHDEPNVMRHVRAVDEAVERAIHEVDRASVIDHKDMDDHPRIDVDLDRPGRFRKAMELLQRARRDIAAEEDNPNAVGWRNLAYRHLDVAMDQLRRAARDLRMDRMEGF